MRGLLIVIFIVLSRQVLLQKKKEGGIDMRRKRAYVGVVLGIIGLAVVSFLLVARGGGEESNSQISSPAPAGSGAPPEAVAGGSVSYGEQFCTPIERTRVDFGVLNDVRILLATYSVFEETAQDPELLLRSAVETIFGYLGVPASDIPGWVHEIVNRELASNPSRPDFSVLNEVYEELILDPRYSDLKDPSRLEALIETSIRGVIDALGDPFANYVSADALQAGATSNDGRYRGIGIGVGSNDKGEIVISSVFEGSPAERAKLRANDVILEVNGLSIEQCNVSQFILRVKGLSDPRLILTIARESTTSTERDILTDIEVIMENIKQLGLSTYPGIELPDGRGSTIKDIRYNCNGAHGLGMPCPFVDADGDGTPDILYVAIHEFTDQMWMDLQYFLQGTDLSVFSGVVIDVRDNGGGLVKSVVAAVDFFLPTDDYIYITRNANGIINRTRSNVVTYIDPDVPIVILTNKDSYSGAELFPAALRDNGRAIIVSRDERTGGKGTVNKHYTLRLGEYGAVYVSFLLWLTPSGEVIEAQDLDNDGYYETGGLTPDIRVEWSDQDFNENSRDVNYDPTLWAALDYLKEHAK